MADDVENDDQWLYGDAPDIPTLENGNQEEEEEALTPAAEPEEVTAPAEEEKEPAPADKDESESEAQDPAPPGTEEENADKQNGDGSDHEDSDDDSDDDVNVVIGDIKTTPAYTSLNIKRGGLLTSTATDKSKQLQQPGKFNVDEFEQMGIINGVQAVEYNLDLMEDKPWRKPGADITDYFNYGFNEDTWKAYCERQKRLRVNESGVGLVPLNSIGLPRGPIPIMNDNSKYSGTFLGIRKAGPPPGRRMTGAIDVIGGPLTPGAKGDAPKENVIQVMTADRREYSRKPPGFPDLSMPPPSFEEFQPEFGFNPEPEPFYGGYEPTQDSQWGTGATNPNWVPTDIKSLTTGPAVPGPTMVPAPVPAVVPTMVPPVVPPVKESMSPPPRKVERAESRDRESTSRCRSEKPRDRDRERSHRRERSRSRSRRHKSRSRSPSHRSHRKSKKSRRHDDSD